jgi:hypothetical protein
MPVAKKQRMNRAQRLLWRILTPEERKHYKETGGQIRIVHGERTYYVTGYGQSQIVDHANGQTYQACIQWHPHGYATFPAIDLAIAKILLIKNGLHDQMAIFS